MHFKPEQFLVKWEKEDDAWILTLDGEWKGSEEER